MFYYLNNNDLENLSASVRVGGPDAYTYLQGQCSQDLNHPPGAVSYGLWLNQKGKIVADSFVLRLAENDFQLFSPMTSGRILKQRLESCLVADEVSVADETASWSSLSLWGGGASQAVAGLLGQVPKRSFWMEANGIRGFVGRRSAGENFELLVPREAAVGVDAALRGAGGEQAEPGMAERERISAGLPAIPVDLGSRDFPNEGGLDDVAISYTKGCYLGQEVMARLKNLGQVRRRLHLIRGPGAVPPAGALLYQGGRKVGEIRSGARAEAGFVALAMLLLANLSPASGLSAEPAGESSIEILRRV